MLIRRGIPGTVVPLEAPVVLLPLQALGPQFLQAHIMGVHGKEFPAFLIAVQIKHGILQRLHIYVFEVLRNDCIRREKHADPMFRHTVHDVNCAHIAMVVYGQKTVHSLQLLKPAI